MDKKNVLHLSIKKSDKAKLFCSFCYVTCIAHSSYLKGCKRISKLLLTDRMVVLLLKICPANCYSMHRQTSTPLQVERFALFTVYRLRGCLQLVNNYIWLVKLFTGGIMLLSLTLYFHIRSLIDRIAVTQRSTNFTRRGQKSILYPVAP